MVYFIRLISWVPMIHNISYLAPFEKVKKFENFHKNSGIIYNNKADILHFISFE